jgi:hypothetical protein
MAEMKGHDQVERHLSHRLDQQSAVEPVALVKRDDRIDKGRTRSRKTRVSDNLPGRVNGAGDGLRNSGRTGLGVCFAVNALSASSIHAICFKHGSHSFAIV